MDYMDVVQAAFEDELQKIAYVRAGRKPISIERLLERETEVESPSVELDLIQEEPKTAAVGKFPVKETALIGAGALGYHQARKVKRRYQLGKQVEMQNQGY